MRQEDGGEGAASLARKGALCTVHDATGIRIGSPAEAAHNMSQTLGASRAYGRVVMYMPVKAGAMKEWKADNERTTG